MPTSRLVVLNISLKRQNNRVLTIQPRVRLRVINNLVTLITTRSQDYTRLVSSCQQRLRRPISNLTINEATSNSTTYSGKMLNNNTMNRLLTTKMTSMNHTLTRVIRRITRHATRTITNTTRRVTRRLIHLTNGNIPNETSSTTISRTMRRVTNTKRGSILRVLRNLLVNLNYLNNNPDKRTYNLSYNILYLITSLFISLLNNFIHRTTSEVRHDMLPRIANRVIRSSPISLTYKVNNMMTSITFTRDCPQ